MDANNELSVSGAKKELKDITECGICRNTFSDPRSLPCLHTFCLDCLKMIASGTGKRPGSAMLCPLCRAAFTIPEESQGGMTALKKNFTMKKLVKVSTDLTPSKRKLCDICAVHTLEQSSGQAAQNEIPPAETYCCDCKQRMCNVCSNTHRQHKILKTHDIKPLDDVQVQTIADESTILGPSFCDIHDRKPLDIYCADCNIVVCALCFVKSHNKHNAADANEVVVNFRRQIQNNIDKLSGCLTADMDDKKDTDELRANLLREIEDLEKTVIKESDEFLDKITKRLAADRKLLLDELNSLKEKTLRAFEFQKDDADRQVKEVKTFMAFSKEMKRKGSPSYICGAINEMNSKADLMKLLHEVFFRCRVLEIPSFGASFKKTELEELLETNSIKNIIGELSDEGRSEYTLRHMIRDISNFKENDHSFSFNAYVRHLPWQIMTVQKTRTRMDQTVEKVFGFFLKCTEDISKSASWSCNCSGELRLLNQRPGGKHLIFDIRHKFCQQEDDWGFRAFITMADLLNPVNGYIKDNAIILEAYIRADVAEGVYPLEVRPTNGRTVSLLSPFEMDVQVLVESAFDSHQGYGLFDMDNVLSSSLKVIRVRKSSTLKEFLEKASEVLRLTVPQIRVWPLSLRQNKTFRPTFVDMERDVTMEKLAMVENPLTFFVETVGPKNSSAKLPSFDASNSVLLFLKKYIPRTRSIRYYGHVYVSMTENISDCLVPIIFEIGKLPAGCEIMMFEEVEPNCVEEITDMNQTLTVTLRDVSNGDILIFQENDQELTSEFDEFATVEGFFRSLSRRGENSL